MAEKPILTPIKITAIDAFALNESLSKPIYALSYPHNAVVSVKGNPTCEALVAQHLINLRRKAGRGELLENLLCTIPCYLNDEERHRDITWKIGMGDFDKLNKTLPVGHTDEDARQDFDDRR